jgi:general secretion pathway protein G
MKPRRRQRGFTLIEMVVVVAIMGVLVMSARPMLQLAHRRSQEFALREALRSLRTAIDDYKRLADQGAIAKPADASGYPPSLAALVEGVPDPRSPNGSLRHYLLRRLPRDPFADPALPAAETWALRSYESPPEEPQPGRDVFDVASRANTVALDGTKVSQW